MQNLYIHPTERWIKEQDNSSPTFLSFTVQGSVHRLCPQTAFNILNLSAVVCVWCNSMDMAGPLAPGQCFSCCVNCINNLLSALSFLFSPKLELSWGVSPRELMHSVALRWAQSLWVGKEITFEHTAVMFCYSFSCSSKLNFYPRCNRCRGTLRS